jgi:phosphoribosylaminoimidazole carboxylase PurE protein
MPMKTTSELASIDPGARVLVLMGSQSDFDAMAATVKVLDSFEVPFELRVASAHRTPSLVHDLVRAAEEGSVKVIVAAAGMAAHLAGVVAGHTTLPVIGVPMDAPPLSGLDSLYSTVMMPPGIPVATVGIGKAGATNAAYLAISILALGDPALRRRLQDYRANLPEAIVRMNAHVDERLREVRDGLKA